MKTRRSIQYFADALDAVVWNTFMFSDVWLEGSGRLIVFRYTRHQDTDMWLTPEFRGPEIFGPFEIAREG